MAEQTEEEERVTGEGGIEEGCGEGGIEEGMKQWMKQEYPRF